MTLVVLVLYKCSDEFDQFFVIFHTSYFSGDSVEISDPLGCLDAWSDCAETVLMLAAGTGLAPMLRLAAVRLKSNKMCIFPLFLKIINLEKNK